MAEVQVFNLWEHSWEELRSLFAARKTVSSLQGFLVCSPDRKCDTSMDLDKAFHQWVDDITFARCRNLPVSPEAVQEIANWKASGKITRPDKETAAPTILEVRKTPIFSWSHSPLEDFDNCPLGYAHKRFYKDNPPEEEKDYQIWGVRVHKALELYLKGEAQPDTEIEVIKPYLPYADAIKNAAIGGELHAELELALTQQLKPTEWYAKDAWGRAILDAAVIKGDTAWIFDFKTGKVKNNANQLKLFCAFLAIFYPQVKCFHAKFIWLKFAKVTGLKDHGLPEPLPREALLPIWQETLTRVGRVKQAWDTEQWQAKPSGLCPYCGYIDCKYRRR